MTGTDFPHDTAAQGSIDGPLVLGAALVHDAVPAAAAVPNEDALPNGTELLGGQYVIERYLSSGGFGITYLARDSLERRVVIKECFPGAMCRRAGKQVRARSCAHAGEYQSMVAMFVREAHSIAKLDHPNIVGVHQVFEDNETAYMALDLIGGRDLLCHLEQDVERFKPDVIVAMLRRLLDAIGTVHRMDMLHRDISPDNILINQSGEPVLIDFGAAREQASKKTRAISALMVVKDGYSPQEFYISGGQQGAWSDLYSLAATFVHLITGEAPPDSQTRVAALAAKRADPYVPLVGRVDGYEDAFLRAIDRTMNVFPQDRLQSASAWSLALDAPAVRIGAPQSMQDAMEMIKVIARLVSEVNEGLAQDRKWERENRVDDIKKAAEVPEKVWEYLLPEEDYESEAMACNSRHDRTDGIAMRIASMSQNRTTMRRGSVLVMLAAIIFSVFDNPTASFAMEAPPEIRQLIDMGRDLGRDLTARTADILKTAL